MRKLEGDGGGRGQRDREIDLASCNFRVSDLEKLLAVARIRPAIDQVERHRYFAQKGLSSFLAKNGIVGEAWYPLGHGFLRRSSSARPCSQTWPPSTGRAPHRSSCDGRFGQASRGDPESTDDLAHIEENVDIYDFVHRPGHGAYRRAPPRPADVPRTALAPQHRGRAPTWRRAGRGLSYCAPRSRSFFGRPARTSS